MESLLARKMHRTLEPVHGMIYFSPRATEAYDALGLPRQAGYFAARSAPMGAVSADVVIATFYNFHPTLVRAAIPAAWDIATPAAILDARFGAADATLREILGDEVVASDELAWAAATARRAAEACDVAGRPLFAGHAGLDWPDSPLLELWHAISLLREYRGDAHVSALMLADVGPCEALHTHVAAADGGLPAAVLKSTRAWPDDEWNAAGERLRSRGWLTEDGQFTAAGRAAREQIEQTTDERSMAPWVALGQDDADRLRATVRTWSRTIAASNIFGNPAGLG